MSYFNLTPDRLYILAIIRNTVEAYFNLNMKERNLKKRWEKADARMYFCYLSSLYTSKTHGEIGEYLRLDQSTVSKYIAMMRDYRPKKTEFILSELMTQINAQFMKCGKMNLVSCNKTC